MGIGRVGMSARVYCKHGIYDKFYFFIVRNTVPVFHFFEKVNKVQLKNVNFNH